MTIRPSRRGTGDPQLDQEIRELLDHLRVEKNRDQIFETFSTIALLGRARMDRLNLKIMNSASRELLTAFEAFRPYTKRPKVTMFGSARTAETDPLYAQAFDTAKLLSQQGWMVVTGGGPGIMSAGLEGAGLENAFGINIQLPFEQSANPFISADPKLVTMKYFFTRKLMMLKESDGFIVLPGGFGTLDEIFELLTLVQTGKAEPAPIVLLDVPGGEYWVKWADFIDEVLDRHLISPNDKDLYLITDSAEHATAEILEFYRNYHSRRFVGKQLVMRLQNRPTEQELAELNDEFGYFLTEGTIHSVEPFPVEVSGNDQLDKPRIAFAFDNMHHGGLRQLINRINGLDSAPKGQPDARHYQAPEKEQSLAQPAPLVEDQPE